MNAYTFWKELDSLTDNLLNPVSTPRVDVRETPEYYELTAELPGIQKDEVTVVVRDGVLELTAIGPQSKSEAEVQWLLRERCPTGYERSFRLPRDVETDAIEAAFRDGLLVLTLPKREEAKPRTVTIKAA